MQEKRIQSLAKIKNKDSNHLPSNEEIESKGLQMHSIPPLACQELLLYPLLSKTP